MIVAFKWSKTECVVEEVSRHFLRILINSGMRSIVKHPKILLTSCEEDKCRCERIF